MLSPLPGGCSAVGEGTLCMDVQRSPVPPFSVPGACCALRFAWCAPPRSTAVQAPSLPPRLLSPSLRASVCLCPHLPGCACRLSAPPPPQDARGARPGAALAAGLAGGGRGQNRGLRPEAGGWGVGTEASGPPRGCCGDWEEGIWGGEEVWSRRRRRGLESRAPTWGPR